MTTNNNMAAHVKRIQREFNAFGMRRYLSLMAIRNSERDVTLSINPIGSDGTSYTNGKKIVLTLWKDLFPKKFPVIKMAMEAFTAHEAEHCRSSNFNDMKRCAEEVGKYYNTKYGYRKEAGEKLGASLYNIVEDGRIERIACNRFPGQIRGIKYINSILWMMNALDVNVERNVYSDFMAAILCLSKTGVKPKNWDVLYLMTEADNLLNQIAYIIYDATCSDFTEDVVTAVLEINKVIDPFIHEALEKDSEFMDKLEQMAQDASDAVNSAEQQASQAGSNGSGTSINSPKGIPSPGQGNGQGSGSGNGQGSGSGSSQGAGVGNQSGADNAQDASDTAEDIEKQASDLENEIENDEAEQEAIQKRLDQNQQIAEENSDDEVSKEELNDIEKKTGLSFGKPQIEHFQQALQEADVFEATEDVKRDGGFIYNQLKKLFIQKNDFYMRKQKRGRLDVSRLSSYVAMNNVGQIEDRIFYKIKKAIQVSCAAYIIVDTSGSTGGMIFDNSMDACAKIELGFGQLIPIKIAAYDSDYNFRFRVIRDFNNKRTDVNLSYNFKKHQSAGGGTPTGEAMALAGYELSKRKEKNKLMIVITDGCPDSNDKVKQEVHRLRKEGIKVIPILVTDSSNDRHLVKSFEEMYEGKDLITQEPSQISNSLIKILTKWITSSFK